MKKKVIKRKKKRIILKGRKPSNKSKASKVNKLKRLAKKKPVKTKESNFLRSLFKQN